MSTLINKYLDKTDMEWDNSLSPTEQGVANKELLLIQVGMGRSLFTIKDRLNLWRYSKIDMNKLYQKLAKLEKELVAAKSQDEKDAIEEEIWEIQDEIDQMEDDKYGDAESEDYK